MHPTSLQAGEVVAFWTEAGPSRWFKKDGAFDAQFRERFHALHETAARGDCAGWAATPDGNLALLILLDQFPRNCFRGSPRAYWTDPLARTVAAKAIARGHDRQVAPELRNFFYLPYMHSEWLPDQQRALDLCRALGSEPHRYAQLHYDAIAQFGRFPHRNADLGRHTTPEEQHYLDNGGFKG
jgi:uncharacterized protein (DUF924 family)